MTQKPFVIAFTFCAAAVLYAQEPPQPPPGEPPAQALGAGVPRAGITPPSQDPQPYEKVITKDAKSAKGIFTVHQIKDRYYYEIPKGELDKEFLLNVRVAKTTVGVGYGGDQMADLVVRCELNGNKVHLRD